MIKTKAFTVVEVVVIVVIIGILASMVGLGWASWNQQAEASKAKSDLNMAIATLGSAKNFQNGYPTALPATVKPSEDIDLRYYSDGLTYCIEARSTKITTMLYSVRSADTSAMSTTACGTAPAAPSPSATAASNSSLNVTWSAVSGATGYTVRYGTASPTNTASCPSSPCTISGLSASTTYYIGVTASNMYGTSTQATTQATTLAAGGGGGGGSLPGGPYFAGNGSASFSSPTSLTLSWSGFTWSGTGSSSCPAGSTIKYFYGYRTSGGTSYPGSGSGTSASFTTLNPDADTNNSVSYVHASVRCVDASNNKTSEGDLIQAYPCNTSYCRTNNNGYPSVTMQ
jgi:type II secretory pathway pseudopilin PulG